MEQFAKETLPVSLEAEMRHSYLDYAMSVIVGRALPDVRDGLKPVHRRVLFAMHEANIAFNRPYVKCARVVGDVMGKYHPHGDMAIYDALVRMAQDFSLRYPLIDGQGNFGSVDGDNPAAMRYTECRLERIAAELLADIDKETVDFVPNYDGKEHGADGPAVARCRTCSSTARRASPSAWRPTSRRTTSPRPSTAAWRCSTSPELTVDELMEHRAGARLPDRRDHLRARRRPRGLSHRPRPRRDPGAHARRGPGARATARRSSSTRSPTR